VKLVGSRKDHHPIQSATVQTVTHEHSRNTNTLVPPGILCAVASYCGCGVVVGAPTAGGLDEIQSARVKRAPAYMLPNRVMRVSSDTGPVLGSMFLGQLGLPSLIPELAEAIPVYID
jgi:hypothetical protein